MMLLLLLPFTVPPTGGAAQLGWDAANGAVFDQGEISVHFGGSSAAASLLLRFPAAAQTQPLREPAIGQQSPTDLALTYKAITPDGIPITIERRVQAVTDPKGVALCEAFTVRPARPLTNEVELEIPFALLAGQSPSAHRSFDSARISVTCPLKNGWAKSFSLSPQAIQAEYRLGACLTGQETPQLALPLLHLQAAPEGQVAAALFADPACSTLFTVGSLDHQISGSLRCCYAAAKVPLRQPETRSFAIWIPTHPRAAKSFSAAVDAWFRLMLPDVPPGPPWLRQIAMVGYDFLSDDGQGWERDVRALAAWLKPPQRRRVALCLHGWYDALGSYCYDAQGRRMKAEWIAFERTRKVKFTQAELKRRLRLARDQGFRVLLYFADGLAADSGVPGYRDDWAYRDANGNKLAGWQGPDTFGPTYLRNPANPEVFSWYTNYLAALLQTYGGEVDGFVWDETFHARTGQIAFATNRPPAWCDRAMLALVKALTRQVHAFAPEKVFLASDCIGVAGWEDVPGYALVADGTYQDSHCDSAAWSYALFPNWRNPFWSCNWDSISGFHNTLWGVRAFGAPVAISNGWGDDRGPSEWSPRERDQILALFRERLKMKARAHFLLDDPRELVAHAPDHPAQGDALAQPGPGEVNWALAANGSSAAASSHETSGRALWPASGVIDGRRDETGWGAGHGWASQAGEPLPQWLEVHFAQDRPVRRFVVINYQKEDSAETAGKWGLQDYRIETWDRQKRKWKPVAAESQAFPAKVRVHNLSRPLLTDRFRIFITKVAPLDGQARLLQLEAWGPTDPLH
ncbi:MAG: discoidin domain-containing protein [Verrucomicrobiota bacterium]|jgi:hypothetical protein